MTLTNRLLIILSLACLGLSAARGGGLEGEIRAAGSDLRIFCPAVDAQNIQWTALLYLNRTTGAEVYIGLIHPSPEFGFSVASTKDGQFHLASIGCPAGMDRDTLADSMISCLFGGIYPDLALFEAGNDRDSLFLGSILQRIQQVSRADTLALAALERIYVRGDGEGQADVILNDRELYNTYLKETEEISGRFETGPHRYKPEQYRKYFRLNPPPGSPAGQAGFLSGLSSFRLPDIISEKLIDGPEKDNLLDRLQKYRNDLRAADRQGEVIGSRLQMEVLTRHQYSGVVI